MSDDQSRPAENPDPLTAPIWEVSSEFKAPEPEVVAPRNIPQPPDVDQILRGEYTGWVPLIKPGDSLDDATTRFEIDNANRANATFEDIFEKSPTIGAEDLAEIKEIIREIKADPEVYVKDFYPNISEIVDDPDTVASPSQALDEARRRIEQMRANLQVNLSRVAESFEHPIFESRSSFQDAATKSEPVEDQARYSDFVRPVEPAFKEEPVRFEMPVREEFKPKPVVFDYVPAEEKVEVHLEDNLEDLVADLLSEAAQESAAEENVFSEAVNDDDEVNAEARFEEYVRQPAQAATLMTEEAVKQDHSLELVIMRDEIKDLRDRLDASQKLIESLMDRLANLAELALTSRNKD